MTSYYNFKKIQVLPSSNDLIDIVLSKVQRKTPTVVHAQYQITRIRQFYMRKVRFAQDCFDEKLGQILTDFPKLDEIHPFYADLMNVLYDKDHYKLALAQVNSSRHLIDNVSKDYVRLMKFADSLFRCKQLKKAALGRMATIMKRQKDSFAYLEQVRQHLARLPSIDPNTRTLILCGYPNVGKSSFMNKLTRANVDVQPYAFTTKSLFVGHMDYKYLRWQIIDTPGILDHPLEDRNTIEMQSITALAHLRACILFFIDLSEQCGYSIQEQLHLFESIKPLFANKTTLLVVNKVDVMRPEQLPSQVLSEFNAFVEKNGITVVQSSCYTDEGVMDVRNTACDKLLQSRVEMKLKGSKVESILNKLHLAQPVQRDDLERSAYIPEAVLTRKKYDPQDPNRPKLMKDIEKENGGAGVFNVDLKEKYMLKDEEWRYDTIPEIMDGKNVADYIDPEIEAKLEALEMEEQELIEKGFYNESADEMEDETTEAIKEAASIIKAKKDRIITQHRIEKGRNRPAVPKKKMASATASKLESKLARMGREKDFTEMRSRSLTRKRARSVSQGDTLMRDASVSSKKVSSRSKSVMRDRSVMGLRSVKQKLESDEIKKKTQKKSNLMAKRGESDRSILTKMPKHLFAGKRGFQADRR